MKTAISIPDDVYREGEALADELGMSRSELYTTALRLYMDERRAEAVRASYDAAFADGDTDEDRAWRRVGRRMLARVEWEKL